ncbi:MAG: TrbI/VirB10 family protein [Bdellovibrionales bacterium]
MSDDDIKVEDDDDLDMDEASFDEFDEGKSRTLGDMFRDSPLFKIGVIVGAIILIFGVIMMFGGSERDIDPSRVSTAPEITTPPGTENASPEYIEAIQEVNERDVEEAQKTGGSALPTPIEPPVGVLTVPEQDTETEDPLERWRRLQEERLERELQQAQTINPNDVDPVTRDQSIKGLSDVMSAQMEAILGSRDNKISYLSMTKPNEFFAALEEAQNQENGQNGDVLADSELEEEVIQEVLFPAGKIAYAQLLIEANSDTPAPVLAQIMNGPLKGSRLIGSFEVQNDYLTITFETVVIDDVSLSIDAIALDPDTTLPGLATDVDHRYLKRILLPMAAAFIEGTANAIAESGLTTVTIQGETVAEESQDADNEQEISSGIEEAGAELREILDEEISSIETLIRVEAGTPMGVLFLEPVVTQDNEI